ncbi:condensation domain-containing protein [Nonomuraea sp. KC401]|uniref:condensation domain-containing protein n=1 Tax=Nonomuraea sp. KC401 TaxID=1848324 RepID=UPI0014867F9F|nr:condensation domain-containing protein [Nonomuraea sp. KC401]
MLPETTARSAHGAPFRTGRASYAQAHRFAMEDAQPDHPQRTLRTAYRIRGPLDPERLASAMSAVVARHDALRMSLHPSEEELRYRVHNRVEWPLIREKSVTVAAGAELAPELVRALDDELLDRFDRSVPPLASARLWELGSDDWLLSLKIDHMIADVLSVGVIGAELSRAYQGETLPIPGLSFADWIEQQDAYFRGEQARVDRAYWDATLAGRPNGWNTLLPDFDLSETAGNAPGAVSLALPTGLGASISAFRRSNRLTPHMVYLSALVLCLARRTGDPDVCVLSATANRSRDLAELVGWCAHGLAYRFLAGQAETPAELARLVRAGCMNVMTHQRYPLLRWRLDNDPGELGRRLRLPYVFLHPITEYFTAPAFAGLDTELVDGTGVEADPCLGFQVRHTTGDEVTLSLHHGGFGYTRAHAERLLADFADALRILTERPDSRLRDLEDWLGR